MWGKNWTNTNTLEIIEHEFRFFFLPFFFLKKWKSRTTTHKFKVFTSFGINKKGAPNHQLDPTQSWINTHPTPNYHHPSTVRSTTSTNGYDRLKSSPASPPSPPDSPSLSPLSPPSWNHTSSRASPGTCGSHRTSFHIYM